MEKRTWKSFVRFLLVAALSGLCVFVSIICLLSSDTPDEKFTPAYWRDCEDRTARYAMHRDLLNHIKVIGMTRQQSIDLLGPVDAEDPNRLSWCMGQSTANQDDWLDFYFNNGVVQHFDIRRGIKAYDVQPLR